MADHQCQDLVQVNDLYQNPIGLLPLCMSIPTTAAVYGFTANFSYQLSIFKATVVAVNNYGTQRQPPNYNNICTVSYMQPKIYGII